MIPDVTVVVTGSVSRPRASGDDPRVSKTPVSIAV